MRGFQATAPVEQPTWVVEQTGGRGTQPRALASDTTVVTHDVPVGKVHKVFGYGISPDSTAVDKFSVKIDGVAEAMVYTRTYDGSDIEDYMLVDKRVARSPRS